MNPIGYSWTGCPAILACWHYRKEVGVTALCAACSRFDEQRPTVDPNMQCGACRDTRKWSTGIDCPVCTGATNLRPAQPGVPGWIERGEWVGLPSGERACVDNPDGITRALPVLRTLLAALGLQIMTKAEARVLEALRYAAISLVRDEHGVVYQMARHDEDRVCGAEVARRETKA